MEEVEEVDGYQHLEDESTDSMTSATNLDTILPLPAELDTKSPYMVKRLSGTGGLVYYQQRTSLATSGLVPGAAGGATASSSTGGRGTVAQVVAWVLSHPPSTILLTSLTGLLVLLLCSSVYLVARLDGIQARVDAAIPGAPTNLEQLANWQTLLHSQSSRRVQEYLNTNLDQISKVTSFCSIMSRKDTVWKAFKREQKECKCIVTREGIYNEISLSLREIRRPEAKGFPESSGNISSYTP